MSMQIESIVAGEEGILENADDAPNEQIVPDVLNYRDNPRTIYIIDFLKKGRDKAFEYRGGVEFIK